jgi:hypothetical protein
MSRSCPNCGSLESCSLDVAWHVRADYYLCRDCKHIWSVNRKTGDIIQHVTPLKLDRR